MGSVDNKYELIHHEYNQLTTDQQEEALEGAFKKVKNRHPATIPIYRSDCQANDEGPDEFKIPAMSVPAMLDMNYNGKNAPDQYKKRYLQKYGEEGKDWIALTKQQFFNSTIPGVVKFRQKFDSTNTGVVEYPIPGWSSKKLIFSQKASNNVKWYFVTPRFARRLLRKPKTQISANLEDFYDQIHEFTRSLKQAVDRGDVALVRINQRLQELEPDYQRAKKRLKGIEVTKSGLNSVHNKTKTERESLVVGLKQKKSGGRKNKYSTNMVGALYPIINGKINVALTGQTRGDFARDRGKKVSSVNYREYWDEELTEQGTVLMRKINRCVAQRGLKDHDSIQEMVDEMLIPFSSMRETVGHGEVLEKKMNKKRAKTVKKEYEECKYEKRKLLKNK